MSEQPPIGPQGPPTGRGPQPPHVPPSGDDEERRRQEEWQRYQEWQRYEAWRRQQWEQWQAWQHEQWRRQWEAHHAQLAQQRDEGELVEPPRFPHAEPTPYHLVQRTWTYHWWRPLVGIVLLVVGMLLVVPFLTLPVLLVGVAIETGGAGLQDYFDALTSALDLTELSPSGLLWLNLSLGGLILWAWLLNRVLHNLRPGWLTSVMPKMRWRFFWVCMGISVVALVAQIAVGFLIPAAGDPTVGDGPNPVTGQTIALLVVVMLTTPLQAAGEEYAFRGYLLQAVGALSKRAWVALVVTSLLFAAAHGVQNFPLFFDRFMFGVIAGWLVIRTGGLEAAIALHILNNLLAFGLGIFYGDLDEMIQISEVSWWNIPVTLTQSVLYVVLVLLVARRMQVQRTSRPPVAEEVEEQPTVVG